MDLADIHAVAVSHLHYDHAGGLKHFAGRVPVHIQRAEYDYGMSSPPGPERNGIFRVDFDDPRIDWRPAQGDAEIAPGVTAVLTAGHTPGHQSFVVEMDPSAGGGGFVFAFDAADLTENIDREVAVGGRIGASRSRAWPRSASSSGSPRSAATRWCPATTRTSGPRSPPNWPRRRPRAGEAGPEPAGARRGPAEAAAPSALGIDTVHRRHAHGPVASAYRSE